MEGWVKIHRAVLDWEWADVPEMFSLWIHLIMSANHEDKKWHGMLIPRGSLVVTRESLATLTGLSVRSVRTGIQRLVDGEQISVKTTNKFTVVTICKYADYQDAQEGERPTNDQQTTSQRPQTRMKEGKKKKIYLTIYLRKRKPQNPLLNRRNTMPKGSF